MCYSSGLFILQEIRIQPYRLNKTDWNGRQLYKYSQAIVWLYFYL